MIEVNLKKKLISSSGNINLDVDFKIERNSFTAVTGISGSGKTTLLRCIAGLAEPDAGCILCDDKIWFSSAKKQSLPSRKRNIGFVFQDYALFPNMTLRENIFYACEDKNRTDEFIAMSDLEGVSNLYPDKLSSGQKQRCAILRAVSRGPEILLLDEPFSSLDGETKKLFHSELTRWRNIFNLTIIMVSHDRAEVVRLAERVLQMKKGIIESDVSHKSGCISRMASLNTGARRVS